MIEDAFFFSGLDWPSLVRPAGIKFLIAEIRPYCIHILHHLVYIHASVSEVSEHLLPIIMEEMVMYIAQELLMAVRRVDRFSVAGMLQVVEY
jgi:hypothetical protein